MEIRLLADLKKKNNNFKLKQQNLKAGFCNLLHVYIKADQKKICLHV